MSPQLTDTASLSPLDLILCVMDSPKRPLDFTLVLHVKKAPNIEALQAGARSARNRYPATGSYIDGKQWAHFAEPAVGVAAAEATSDETITGAIEAFIDGPFNPRRQVPVQQLVIIDGANDSAKLVTRFHHAVADYLSATMWLGHQLRVAYGQQSPVTEVSPFQELPLRRHPSPVKKSRFSYLGPAHHLWSPRARSSRARRWHTIEVPAVDLRERSRKIGGFTYNDLLATCALEVFVRWNCAHNTSHRQKVGLLLPVNIRQQPFEGFGNGASRIRIYARYTDNASLLDKCREIRRQVAWSKQHGEWAVPRSHPLTRLPVWASVPLLRCYLNRPWVDVTTGVFSHAERWDGQDDRLFQHVEKIEFIGQLHARYAVAINATTLRDQTWVTFTYDPGLLTSGDIQRLVEMYQEQIALAQRELT